MLNKINFEDFIIGDIYKVDCNYDNYKYKDNNLMESYILSLDEILYYEENNKDQENIKALRFKILSGSDDNDLGGGIYGIDINWRTNNHLITNITKLD